MNKTKEAISNFMSKAGHHDTTVHESVNPSVQHETIKPTQHEEVNTAVDREVHQDHYHHTVQPVHDKEVLPEQHHHQVGEVEHRKFDHRDDTKTKRALEAEAAKFKDESVRTETTHTRSHVPQVAGEHVHHHVHETYQPVVHKETVEPHVVHTTVPIHETHHNATQHHATSMLPAVSMSEFKQHGGTHTGGQHEHHTFEGCPDTEGGSHTHNKGLRNIMHSGSSGSSSTNIEGVSGPHSSRIANAADPRVDSDRDGSATLGTRSGGNNLGSQGGYSTASQSAAATGFGSGASHQRIDSGHGLNDHDSSSKLGGLSGRSQGSSVFDKVNSGR